MEVNKDVLSLIKFIVGLIFIVVIVKICSGCSPQYQTVQECEQDIQAIEQQLAQEETTACSRVHKCMDLCVRFYQDLLSHCPVPNDPVICLNWEHSVRVQFWRCYNSCWYIEP